MKKNLAASYLGTACLLLLTALSPWITDEFASSRAQASFAGKWRAVSDGCGTDCTGCGAVSSRKVPFGRTVTLAYACGLRPADDPAPRERTELFVSFLGTVHE
ncbi:hypothetical protein J31TS4_38190 [Paenibacillus sp. J31TS4]|uniref:hypothetical protein n=1 Tax=Paenibacillus sp. J31TS4 TaxID=2807195 RepID=UPI001AFD6C67|nr:hypothetical protein [Paenibacillus sp. J31TS4]GIP40539.1 hypothetical protein J31TS4_38190 [Paenibacillus sp. J31TS4]